MISINKISILQVIKLKCIKALFYSSFAILLMGLSASVTYAQEAKSVCAAQNLTLVEVYTLYSMAEREKILVGCYYKNGSNPVWTTYSSQADGFGGLDKVNFKHENDHSSCYVDGSKVTCDVKTKEVPNRGAFICPSSLPNGDQLKSIHNKGIEGPQNIVVGCAYAKAGTLRYTYPKQNVLFTFGARREDYCWLGVNKDCMAFLEGEECKRDRYGKLTCK